MDPCYGAATNLTCMCCTLSSRTQNPYVLSPFAGSQVDLFPDLFETAVSIKASVAPLSYNTSSRKHSKELSHLAVSKHASLGKHVVAGKPKETS